ncbi:hypothetical protein [Mesorhizobium sp. M2E.F.Ca.ET.209.01.1.1]|uniref:hypothetical protein n=1 Tax=Mesorhizobium sp. M2E.F.Ca.ET.209.01.1.1 TaxID=2500526 RepID=UPI001FEEF6B8|nr:hypothetical protein [Mesorhizobium sp. M2E.F.Ca.ET.209.01.1.1]
MPYSPKFAATPAQSLAGVIAKLAIVVREATDNTCIFEFPLPHIRFGAGRPATPH